MTTRSTTGTGLAFAAVTTLFFAWGFITSLIDPLVAAVKGIFTLTDVQAQLSPFAFFIAYGLVSLPAAVLVARFRAAPSILLALATMIAGCLVMLLAANLAAYNLVLVGLFILASGITVLQVAANPLAAGLGDPRSSHFRLTFSQTFNSLGTFVGPLLGAHLFLKGVEVKPGSVVTQAVREQTLAGIDTAYLWISALLALLLLFFYASRKLVAAAAPTAGTRRNMGSMLAEIGQARWALWGGLIIFLYVGAEVAIGSQMALFLNSDAVWGQSDLPFTIPLLGTAMGSDGVPGVSLQEAGKAVAFYWGGLMAGRALGAVLLPRVSAAALLAAFAAAATGLCIYVAIVGGVVAGFAVILIGLFNSIIFPVVFTLTLERSSASEEATSGFLCMAIVGGAFVPLVMGKVSGVAGYGMALLVPAVCYVAVLAFAIAAGRSRAVRHSDILLAH
jgi:FHS family L-fucose permease-like MFS transporter